MRINRLAILATLLLAIALCSHARDCYNYFYARGDVCLPVTVKASEGSFTITYDGQMVEGYLSYVEAWDCRGRKIIMPRLAPDGYSSDQSVPVERVYVFQYLYDDSDSGYSDSSSGSGYRSGGYDPWAERLTETVRRGSTIYDPGYPNATFQLGISNVYGEFFRAKGCFGGRMGFVVYGGIGHDWIFKPKNEDFIGPKPRKKISWHAGLGMYGGALDGVSRDGEFQLLIDYAETALVDNGSVNIKLEGSWYFGNDGRFGAFAGIGASAGNLKQHDPTWHFIFDVGLAYRFF